MALGLGSRCIIVNTTQLQLQLQLPHTTMCRIIMLYSRQVLSWLLVLLLLLLLLLLL